MREIDMGFEALIQYAKEIEQIVLGTYKLQMFKWRLSGFSFDIHAEGSSIMSSLLLLVKS